MSPTWHSSWRVIYYYYYFLNVKAFQEHLLYHTTCMFTFLIQRFISNQEFLWCLFMNLFAYLFIWVYECHILNIAKWYNTIFTYVNMVHIIGWADAMVEFTGIYINAHITQFLDCLFNWRHGCGFQDCKDWITVKSLRNYIKLCLRYLIHSVASLKELLHETR